MDLDARYEVLRGTLGVGDVVPATIDPDLALCDPDLRQLAGLVEAVRFRAGEVIIREGDAGDSLYIVGSGKVRIVRLADGNEIPVAELGRGALFGELAVLEGRTRTASVIADTDAELLRLDRVLMKELIAQRSPLSYKILLALTLHVSARVRKQDLERVQAKADMLEALVKQRTLELERTLGRESMINLITGAIRGHLDLDRVLQTTVEQVGRALGADRCFLVLSASTDEGSMRIDHEYAAPGLLSALGATLPRLGQNDPAMLHMLGTRRPYAVDDVENDPMTRRVTVTDPRFIEVIHGVRSLMLVPLFYKEDFLGTLSLYVNTPHAWTEEEKDFVQAIADQVSVAIRQSMLYWEVAEQKDRLADALEEVQRKESQLIQSEKMASLGQLVAGVAHELNNPISIVYGFLGHVGRRLDALRESLARGEAVDEEIFSEVEDMLSRCKEGALRTKNIVADLRTFSRLDEAEFKDADLHAGIESTLHLLHHRLGERIKVHRHYGDLPLIACYPGQLNQVFMNLLGNAIDAIVENGGEGEIHVTTSVTPGPDGEPRVSVAVRDTGSGIPPDKVKRVFDPFFTTKPVGKGTGLGLSVSHGIVEKHGGIIRVESVLGQGSTFVVELPLGPRAR
jgi:two-component system NtrC family sensor kinase